MAKDFRVWENSLRLAGDSNHGGAADPGHAGAHRLHYTTPRDESYAMDMVSLPGMAGNSTGGEVPRRPSDGDVDTAS